ncbi:MAG: hypothetical protein OZSIB_4020 [Candidatus Ozemobacter sibiricus]|uniref:Antitoxin FitA-like ribbon-helix-helix domain-containing protein n=1 Tax=Candidatus Ozemobacter sibiricus TaxID=2268124 RepID=A0A367ZPA6_9BACT|nr:MAG: hypothetical protein OZSIB_4020 [Candidatus Ozemobacter sibiricus]
MATITLKNVPRQIHLGIKKRAEKNHRSINGEILACLERVLGLCTADADDLLANMEKAHEGLRFKVTVEDIRAARREGRK